MQNINKMRLSLQCDNNAVLSECLNNPELHVQVYLKSLAVFLNTLLNNKLPSQLSYEDVVCLEFEDIVHLESVKYSILSLAIDLKEMFKLYKQSGPVISHIEDISYAGIFSDEPEFVHFANQFHKDPTHDQIRIYLSLRRGHVEDILKEFMNFLHSNSLYNLRSFKINTGKRERMDSVVLYFSSNVSYKEIEDMLYLIRDKSKANVDSMFYHWNLPTLGGRIIRFGNKSVGKIEYYPLSSSSEDMLLMYKNNTGEPVSTPHELLFKLAKILGRKFVELDFSKQVSELSSVKIRIRTREEDYNSPYIHDGTFPRILTLREYILLGSDKIRSLFKNGG